MKKKNISIIGFVILGLALLSLIGYYVFTEITKPVFTLKSNEISIEAGEEFNPAEYIDSFTYCSLDQIQINNTVQTAILGEYSVTYTLGENSQEIKVTVVDTLPPTLKITTGELFYFTDEEVTVESLVESATDISDISLSIDTCGQDISQSGDYTIKVVAKDAGENITERLARIHVREHDQTPPTISGIRDLTITAGDSIDLINGIEVEDDIDDYPALFINTEGFDKNSPGQYIIYYSAKDETGNECTESRIITVNPRIVEPVITVEADPIIVDDIQNFIPYGGTVGWDATGKKNQPYLVCVNRAMNTVTVYGKDENGNYTVPVKAMVCSVGREGHETITGRYSTTDRFEWCYMVDGTWGRYAIRIKGGYMFHSIGYFQHSQDTLEYDEYNKLGNPASLGCVRLCLSDIYWLFAYCPSGFETIIYDDYALAGPLGKPASLIIDTTNELTRNWDPTDPENPYLQ